MNYEEEDFVYDWTSGYTKVMWNFQRYPLPDVAEIPLIYGNIESVLEEKYHFRGYMEIMAYGLQPDQYKPYSLNKTIYCEYFPDDTTMTLDILKRTRRTPDLFSARLDLVLITKVNEVDRELLRILEGLASRNHTVYLVEPPEEGRPFNFSNARVLKGRSRPQTDDFIKDFSLKQMVSGLNLYSFMRSPLQSLSYPSQSLLLASSGTPRITHFPDEVRDPDLMYDKIVSGLNDWGLDGKMSIWAYVDETEEYWKDKRIKKTWKANIYFLPREDGRLFHDVILWIKDNPDTYCPFDWSIVILNEPRKRDQAVFEWLLTFNTRSKRYDPDNYCVFRMRLCHVLDSESVSDSEIESIERGQVSSKKAKLVD